MASSLSPYRGGGRVARSGDPLMSFHREMNRLFEDVFRGFGLPAGGGGEREGGMRLQPDIDVSETEKEFKICADLPGVAQDGVDVTLEDDILSIRAERKDERRDEQENYHVVERTYGRFERALRLPANVDAEHVEAKFENGVLTVRIPKTDASRQPRRIPVGARANGDHAEDGAKRNGEPQKAERKAQPQKSAPQPQQGTKGPDAGQAKARQTPEGA